MHGVAPGAPRTSHSLITSRAAAPLYSPWRCIHRVTMISIDPSTAGQPPHSPSRQADRLPCRSGSGSNLTTFLDLGSQPLANALLEERQLSEAEPCFPLELAFCRDCSLVQVTETIPPDVLFGRDYPYYSSFSPALLAHSRDHVQRILTESTLDSRSLVVEVAGNDGYLLRNF